MVRLQQEDANPFVLRRGARQRRASNSKTRQHTGTQRMICTLELFARRKVVTLRSDAFEVVSIILETA